MVRKVAEKLDPPLPPQEDKWQLKTWLIGGRTVDEDFSGRQHMAEERCRAIVASGIKVQTFAGVLTFYGAHSIDRVELRRNVS